MTITHGNGTDLAPRTCNGRHSHGLDTITGYIVRRTVSADALTGEWLTIADEHGTVGVDFARFDGAGTYADALAMARSWRGPMGYAVVDTVYACGSRIAAGVRA